jgi:hypothetical protein
MSSNSRTAEINKPSPIKKTLLRDFTGRHTWVRVASNSLQASLLIVESGSPASFHAYT